MFMERVQLPQGWRANRTGQFNQKVSRNYKLAIKLLFLHLLYFSRKYHCLYGTGIILLH